MSSEDYRQIYNTIRSSAWENGYTPSTPRLLREAGVEVYDYDLIKVTESALSVYLTRRIRELEEEIAKLKGKT